jgi:hypothetical protein
VAVKKNIIPNRDVILESPKNFIEILKALVKRNLQSSQTYHAVTELLKHCGELKMMQPPAPETESTSEPAPETESTSEPAPETESISEHAESSIIFIDYELNCIITSLDLYTKFQDEFHPVKVPFVKISQHMVVLTVGLKPFGGEYHSLVFK